MRRLVVRLVCACALAVVGATPAAAQVFSQRGFIDGTAWLYPERAPRDQVRAVGDALVREEVFYKPADWLQFAGGVELRGNTHEQVDTRWRLDVSDRGAQRPLL